MQRVTALEALEAPYFKEEQPPPELPVEYVMIHFLRVSSRSMLISF
jgi:hypothetical protein